MSRLAAIDVGSHAVRLVVVEISPIGMADYTEFIRWPIRLGAEAFAHRRIQPGRVRMLVGVFVEIARHFDRLGVRAYRAVATAAMRDARNGAAIVEQIRKTTGIEVEIISGNEEGRLSRDALTQSLGSVPADTLLVDLGGGSLELHRAHGRLRRSMPLGTVRLLDRYPELVSGLTRTQTKRLALQIQDDLEKRLEGVRSELALGTGGNLDALARLVPSKPGFYPAINVTRLPAATMRIAAMAHDERIRVLGIRPDRADVIVPAALLVLAVANLCSLRSIVVPGTGLRETILRSLAAQTESERTARKLVKKLNRKGRQAESLLRLAVRLFDVLAPVHGLWPPALAPLAAAAYVHAHGPASLNPGHLAARPRQVASYAAAAAAGQHVSALRADVAAQDRRPADVLAGLLRVAAALAQRGAFSAGVDVDLTKKPVVIRAGLVRPLPRSVVGPLEDSTGVTLRVK